jgi:hypothetical protein
VLDSISVSPANVSIGKSGTQQFTATPTYSDGTHTPMPTPLTWSSSNTSKVTIDASSGLATAVEATTSPVTINATSGAIQGTATINVTAVVLVLLPPTQTVTLNGTFQVIVQAQCGTLTTDGIETYLDFDPAYLAVQSAAAGTTLPIVMSPPAWDNTAGIFGFSAGKLTAPFPSGIFTVVTITFQAKSVTTSTAITFHTTGARVTYVDSSGSNITGTLSGGSYTIPDFPPSVTAISPLGGAADISISSPLVLTFNKAMNQPATQGAFSLSPPVSGNFTWNTAGTVMTFTPVSGFSYSTAYTLGLSTAAADLAGLHLVIAFNSTFTTIKGLTSMSVTPATITIVF